MTNSHIPQHTSMHDLIAEAFNVATIALVGVVGILTVAVTF